jgi:hypothetical protein
MIDHLPGIAPSRLSRYYLLAGFQELPCHHCSLSAGRLFGTRVEPDLPKSIGSLPSYYLPSPISVGLSQFSCPWAEEVLSWLLAHLNIALIGLNAFDRVKWKRIGWLDIKLFVFVRAIGRNKVKNDVLFLLADKYQFHN